MAQVSLVSANLAAGFLETFFYGLFFLLYLASTWFMAQRHRRLNCSSVQSSGYSVSQLILSLCGNPLFVVGNLLFVLLTAHWVLVVYGTFQAFIDYDDGKSPGDFWENLATPSQIGRTTIFSVSLFVADLALLYRLYVIWEGNKYVMIFPVCSFFLSLASGIAVLVFENSGSFAFDSDVIAWILASTVGTFCTNVSSCGLIVWRLWRIHSISEQHFSDTGGSRRGGVKSLQWTISVLIESAALYAGWTVFYIATYAAGSNLESPVSDAWLPITGISFMLINVRVGLGYTNLHSAASGESSTTVTVSQWGVVEPRTEDSMELNVINVNSPPRRPIELRMWETQPQDEEEGKASEEVGVEAVGPMPV